MSEPSELRQEIATPIGDIDIGKFRQKIKDMYEQV